MEAADDIDLQPTLAGETLTLRPLRVEDFDALHAVAADPAIWEQHPEPTRYQRLVFESYFTSALASRGALLATDNATGTVIGSSRYYDWDAAARSIAIGYTFLARSHWGGAANREMKRLMLDHAFRWADTVWFHVGRDNHRSRRAMEKLGAELAREAQREHGGVLQDYVYYRIEARRWLPAALRADAGPDSPPVPKD
jgi:RimJ/RimL family protein N-acetyltransferase